MDIQLINMRHYWHRSVHALAKEFRKEQFTLNHTPVDDFVKPQWGTFQKFYLWLLYRWSLAACFSTGVISSLVEQWDDGLWFIYLTNWGFFLCMFASVFGAVLVTVYHFKPNKLVENSFAIKFYWLSHWSTLAISTVITFMYWNFIYPTDNQKASELYNLWAHGFNSILMLLDHFLVAFPTRILHCVYPVTLGLAFGIFSVIYYLADGVNINGHHYIYEILDWSKPAWAILALFGTIILMLVFSILLFCLYKLRQTVYSQCNHSKLIITNA